MHVGIIGTMGIGKSTLMRRLQELFGAECFYEMVNGNPFLARAYEDPNQWALASQLAFLHQAGRQQREIKELERHVLCLQDATLESHMNVYIKVMHERGILKTNDLEVLEFVHGELIQDANAPDLYVHLAAPVEVAIERIMGRDREIERGIDTSYVRALDQAIQQWMNTLAPQKVLRVDALAFNVFDDDQVMDLYQRIKQAEGCGGHQVLKP